MKLIRRAKLSPVQTPKFHRPEKALKLCINSYTELHRMTGGRSPYGRVAWHNHVGGSGSGGDGTSWLWL